MVLIETLKLWGTFSLERVQTGSYSSQYNLFCWMTLTFPFWKGFGHRHSQSHSRAPVPNCLTMEFFFATWAAKVYRGRLPNPQFCILGCRVKSSKVLLKTFMSKPLSRMNKLQYLELSLGISSFKTISPITNSNMSQEWEPQLIDLQVFSFKETTFPFTPCLPQT